MYLPTYLSAYLYRVYGWAGYVTMYIVCRYICM